MFTLSLYSDPIIRASAVLHLFASAQHARRHWRMIDGLVRRKHLSGFHCWWQWRTTAIVRQGLLWFTNGGVRPAASELNTMNTSKMIGIGLLVLGGILLYFGFNATNSPMEELGEAFTGKYSDETMMYLIGGGVAAAAGLFMTLKKG